ncbi:MAG: HEAT repeat domain-containing protein [Planctomycetes bacterium]|nr:HEAT repeat domain-containing protein [Planctomycetota bacterium]
MSHPTDLLPYGELLADTGLIARLLDDGSISLTEDDSLSDDQRVVFKGRPEGLIATLTLFPCPEASTELLSELENLNSGQAKFFWEDGVIGCAEALSWTADHQFPLDVLRGLYTRVAKGRDHQESLLALALASGSGSAPAPAPGSDAPALPPSFLPGQGQGVGGGVTQRYGGINETPGRAEVDDFDTRSKSRRYKQGEEGGSKVVIMAAAGTVVLLGLVGAAAMFVSQRDTDGFGGSSSPGVAVASPTAAVATPDPDEPFDPNDRGHRPWASPKATAEASQAPAAGGVANDVYVLAASVDADDRSDGVKRWRRKKLYRRDGSRLKLLNALDGRQTREQSHVILETVRSNPPEVLEGLDILERLTPGNALWRELVEQFGTRDLSSEERDVVSDVLRESADTKDLVIEETLIRIGRSKTGGGTRLVAARGVQWLLVKEGLAVFSLLPLEEQAKLLDHSDPRARLAGVKLIGKHGRKNKPADALKYLSKYLASKDTELKRRAIEEVGSLGEGVGAWYLALAMMKEKDRRSLELLRNALARLPSKGAISFLRKLAKHAQADRRRAAISALRVIRHPDAINVIMVAVRDKDRKVRIVALSALAGMAKDSEHRLTVGKGVLDYRRIAKDRSDPEARRLARQLCLAIDGRLPR